MSSQFEIFNGDCLEGMQKLDRESADLVVADPPWGIAWPGYADYSDALKDREYLAWCEAWMQRCYEITKPTGSFWLAIGPEYVSELDVLAKRLKFHKRHQIVQYSTFGVASTKNFARSHNFWLYYTKHRTKFVFNADDPEVRVPSARQLRYNDKRANPQGKLPDGVWVLHPDYLQACFTGTEDVWLESRVAGSFKERVFRGKYGKLKTCPQMPLAVMRRIIRTTSNRGDLVVDPFGGTFATGAAAISLGRRFFGCELSAGYCEQGQERLAAAEKAMITGEVADSGSSGEEKAG